MTVKVSYHPRAQKPRLRTRSVSKRRRFSWNFLLHHRPLISVAVVLIALMILFSALFGQHGYFVLRKQRMMLQQVEQQREHARAERERLKEELNDLRTPAGVERVAREEIKLAKPGEIVVTLPDSGASGDAANPPAKTDPNSPPANPSKNR